MAKIDVRKLAANPIDRVLSYFDPERANRRLAARLQRENFIGAFGGGYDAARPSNRATIDLQSRARDTSADNAITRDLSKLRAASSDLIRNSGIAKSAIDQLCNKSIATGLTPQSLPITHILGVTDDAAMEKAKVMESLFWVWCKRADFNRRFNFKVLERLGLYSAFEQGDAFAVKLYDENPGDLFGFKLQMIEGARVSNPNFKPDTASLIQGIQHDAKGRPEIVWFCNRYPQERFAQMGGDAETRWDGYRFFGEQSGRRNVIHLLFPTRIGQTRGVPALATVIATLEQLTTYTQAELMAAVINSCFAMVFKSDEDASPIPTTGETTQNASLRRVGFTPQPGTLLETSMSEGVESFTPGRPSSSFEPFWEALTNEIGGAVGIAGAVLRRSFKASYSASRAELFETYQACLIYKENYETMFNQECWEEVQMEAVLRGYIDLPGWQDPLKWAAWMNVDWVGPALPSLDPKKEAEAAEILIRNNLSTQAIQTRRLTGGDWEDNVQQRKRELAALPVQEKPGPGRPAEEDRPENPDQPEQD